MYCNILFHMQYKSNYCFFVQTLEGIWAFLTRSFIHYCYTVNYKMFLSL